MIRLLFLASFCYVALVLDASGGLWSLPAGTTPQFLFLASAISVLCCKGAGAILWSVAAGLLADVVQGAPLGLNVVLLANLAFLAQSLGAGGSRDAVVTSAAFVLIYVALAGFASIAAHEILSGVAPHPGRACLFAASRAGGTAAIYLLVAGSWRMSLRAAELILSRPNVHSDRSSWAR
jgi:cell shape-determining protein MreD